MIKTSEYNRVTAAEWMGVKVRSLRPITTGMMTIPAGTIFSVEGKFSGFDVKADPCSHCGVQARVSRVSCTAFERVETNDHA